MELAQEIFEIETCGQGLYEFTDRVQHFVAQCGMMRAGLSVFCCHTSCSLIIQENADRDVQRDLQEFFSRLAPEGMDWVRHTCEGPDDMPAHIKSALTATSLCIPVDGGRAMLGTWQGIYLFEHRARPHHRKIVVQMIGE